MESDFLEMRRQLLFAGPNIESEWPRDHLAVSDFWFDQSAAFARAWLEPDQFTTFERRFEEVRREVVRPKLLVLLDAPAEVLFERIRQRGRRGEGLLRLDQLECIRQSILRQAAMPETGPTLKLFSCPAEDSLAEVMAAIESME
jgi:thymidylate kinase